MLLAATVTGLPALIIILVVLALLLTGIFVFFRALGRGAKKVVESHDSTDNRRP